MPIAHAIQINIIDPLGGRTLETIITTIQTSLLPAMSTLMVLVIVIAGFQLMTSAGDEAKRTRGIKTLIWGAVGFLILLMAGVIAEGVRALFPAGAGP